MLTKLLKKHGERLLMDKIEISKRLDYLLDNWSKFKVDEEKCFDDIFKLDGIPLWWFYRRFFVPHVMPKQVNTFKQINTFLIKNSRIALSKNIALLLNSIALGRYLKFKEKEKIKYFKKNKVYDGKEKILFLTYSLHLTDNGKIFRIQNVIDKVKKDGKISELVLFAEPLSGKNYKKLENYNNIYRYYDEEISQLAHKISFDLYNEWKKIGEKTKEKAFLIDNKSIWPFLKFSFSSFWSKEFIYLVVLYYEICKKILRKENIKAIVLTSNNGLFDKCMRAAAKTENVAAFVIQHGTGGYNYNPNLIPSTKAVVFSNFYKEKLCKFGVIEKDIIVAGPIIFDEVIMARGENNKLKQLVKNNDKKRISIDETTIKNNKINLLIATSPFVEHLFINKKEYFERFSKIINDIKNMGEVNLTIKLHPREKHKAEYEKTLINSNLNKTKVIQNCSREEFYNIINKSDSFIHFGSTAAVEAMVLDKPIVTINICSLDNSFNNNPSATIVINYDEDVAKAITNSLENRTEFQICRKKVIEKFLGKMDGNASKRLIEEIYSLVLDKK